MPGAEEIVGVRVQPSTIAYLYEFTGILFDLDRAYNAVYLFFDLARDIEDMHQHWRRYWPSPEFPAILPLLNFPIRGRRKASVLLPSIMDIENPASYVDPGERLALKACQISSPGILDIIGKLNVLDTLRQWAQDRHERRKDREYREYAERERLQLENGLLRNEVVNGRIAVLRELGVPKTSINQVVNKLLVEPIVLVQRCLDSGEIESIERIPPPGEPDGGRSTR